MPSRTDRHVPRHSANASTNTEAIVERTPQGLILEQESELGVLFFVQHISVRLLVTQTPFQRVESRGIGGSFREFSGRYELEPTARGVRLSYTGRWVPAFFLPPLVGMVLVRQSLEKHFSEMIAEIRRRAGP